MICPIGLMKYMSATEVVVDAYGDQECSRCGDIVGDVCIVDRKKKDGEV